MATEKITWPVDDDFWNERIYGGDPPPEVTEDDPPEPIEYDCPVCGESVADTMEECPHCRAPLATDDEISFEDFTDEDWKGL